MEAYVHKSTVGEGAYGTVWRCTETATGADVAVKGFKQAHEEPEIMRMALREVRVLRGLDHPGVVRLLEAFRSKTGRVYMVFPYVGPSAYHAICINRQGLPPAQLRLMTWQLLQALAHLHGRRVVHRDIKPANILLGEGGIVKLCDFGFARSTKCGPRDADKLSSYVCTRWYRAPELLVGCEYGPAADVWSLGCTLAELATGAPLFQGCSSADQLWRIMRCFGPLAPQQARAMLSDSRLMAEGLCVPPRGRTLRERLGPRVDPGLASLLEDCLHVDPRSRPTAAELLQAPYFWTVPPGLLAFTPAVRMAYRLHEAQEQAQEQGLQGPLQCAAPPPHGHATTAADASTLLPAGTEAAGRERQGPLKLSAEVSSPEVSAASEPAAQGSPSKTAAAAALTAACAGVTAIDVNALPLGSLSEAAAAVHSSGPEPSSCRGPRREMTPCATGATSRAQGPLAILRRSVPPESKHEPDAAAAQEPPAVAAPAEEPPSEAPAAAAAEPPPLLGAETAAEAALAAAAVAVQTPGTLTAATPAVVEHEDDRAMLRALSLRQACVVLAAAVERDSACLLDLRRSQTPTPGQQLAVQAAAPRGGGLAARASGSFASQRAAQPRAVLLAAKPSSLQPTPSAGTSGGGPLGLFSGCLGLLDSVNLTHLQGTASAANARLQAGPLAPRLGRDHHTGGEEGAFGYTPGPSSHVVCLAQLATGEAPSGSPAASRVAAMCGLALAPAAGGTPTPPLSPGGALGLGGDGRPPLVPQPLMATVLASAALWPQQQESRDKERQPATDVATPDQTEPSQAVAVAAAAAMMSTAVAGYDISSGTYPRAVIAGAVSGGTGRLCSTAATSLARDLARLMPASGQASESDRSQRSSLFLSGLGSGAAEPAGDLGSGSEPGEARPEARATQRSKLPRPGRRRAQSFTFGARLLTKTAEQSNGTCSKRCVSGEGPASACCTAGILAAASLNDASSRSAAGTAARSAPDLLRWRSIQGRRQGGRTAAVSRPRSRLSLVPGPGAGTSLRDRAVAVVAAGVDASPASGGQTQGATRIALADLFGEPRGGVLPLSTIRSASLRSGRPSLDTAAAGNTGAASFEAPDGSSPVILGQLRQLDGRAPGPTVAAAAADRRGLFGRRRGLLCSEDYPAGGGRGVGAAQAGREGAAGRKPSALHGAGRGGSGPARGTPAGGLRSLLGILASCVTGCRHE
ncbi:hypothetical protein HYH03_004334 [Edaphochlamys debaryana]|uniref:cyclin-dependent kinase n=1 Tax=Edaphochlamys debaryana TaxID=47281 RepID=A0A835YA73_9CHLO|nr:hypothetical protein HYH03_004334 [Edaphochlamys debaryana]|eukprot:KAG2497588.1 hypothetical protein HYH03_004334 [Edaphochlamys debaryana]